MHGKWCVADDADLALGAVTGPQRDEVEPRWLGTHDVRRRRCRAVLQAPVWPAAAVRTARTTGPPRCRRRRTGGHGRAALLVVGRASLRRVQHGVRFVDLLHPALGRHIVRVVIGMETL